MKILFIPRFRCCRLTEIRALSAAILVIALYIGNPGFNDVYGQSTSTDWAWKGLLQQDGLEFAYLFYSKADNTNNGIVLKLTNRNDYPVRYRFRVVFRTADLPDEESEVEIPVSGKIEGRSIRTGENAGLFFVPFKDGSSISEVGLRGYHVDPLE